MNNFLLFVCVGILAVTIEGQKYTLRTTGYDFLPATDYTELCNQCDPGMNTIVHKYNCQLKVQCDPAAKQAYIFPCIDSAAMWGLNGAYCALYKLSPWPTQCKFDEANNPCFEGGKAMIADGTTCNGYSTCKNGGFDHHTCDDGMRFDYAAQACVADSTCGTPGSTKAPRKQHNVTCDAVEGENTKQRLIEYYEDTQSYTQTDVDCPSSMVFDSKLVGTDFCCNQEKNVIGDVCQDQNLVRASSVDDTWSEAMSQQDTPFSKIDGTASIIRNQNSQFNGWAYFNGSTSFAARKMLNNELRYYWSLSFDFQAGSVNPDGSVNIGMQMSNEKVALIDNSACNIDPTYGCHIRMQRLNFGLVECVANNHSVETDFMDLTRTISVEFKRDMNFGTMTVTPQGSNAITRQMSFAEGEIIRATECSMTMGSGYKQSNYVGFMDNVMFYKNCPP